MKKLMLLLLFLSIITGTIAFADEAAPAAAPQIERKLHTTLYMEGDHSFTLGTFKIPLSDTGKVYEVSLTGAGKHVKLSWSAYTSRGNLVVEIHSDALIATGTEKYTLSARIGSTFVSETFSVKVVDKIPFHAKDIVIDIPSALHVGESFDVPSPRLRSGETLSKNTVLTFTCKDSRLTKTGKNHYTATTVGDIPWSATVKNSNYSYKTSGKITVTTKLESTASEIHSIYTGSLNTVISTNLSDEYEVLGTIVVCADVSEGDELSAYLSGADDIVQLYLCDPVVNGSDYLYAVIAAGVQDAGVSEYTFTANAGDCSVSTTFELTVLPSE